MLRRPQEIYVDLEWRHNETIDHVCRSYLARYIYSHGKLYVYDYNVQKVSNCINVYDRTLN